MQYLSSGEPHYKDTMSRQAAHLIHQKERFQKYVSIKFLPKEQGKNQWLRLR